MEDLLGVLIVAAPVGTVYALAASGLVLTYRTSRVFNFAHGAVGMFSAFLFYQAWVVWKVPVALAALLVVVVFAPAMGLVAERLVFRPLRGAATSVKVVVTVGLLVALQGAASLIWGQEAIFLPSLFPEGSVRVFGDIHLGFDQLGILGVSLMTLAILGSIVRWTPFGLRVRAAVDRRDMAELAGIDTGRVSAISWALGFATAGVSGILLSPILGLDSFILTLFVIQAFAAALFGRLESFALTLVGGLLVAFLEEAASSYLPNTCELCLAVRPAVPFALVFVLLTVAALVPRSGLGRWVRAGTAEPSVPPPMTPAGGKRRGWVWTIGLVAALAVAGAMVEGIWLLRLERGLAMAGVFASLILLAGLSGQISLAHTAFVGTGAFMMAFLATDLGVPFFLALLLAGLAAVPVAAFVALPAVRLQGLHVALLTFGFGLVVARFFESRLTGGTTGMQVPRPSLASSDRVYFYVLLAIAAYALLTAWNLHRKPTGRILAATRDSEVAARAIGLRVGFHRMAVFSTAAFLAGAAGAALGGLQGLVSFNDFHPLFSLMWLSVAVIGGMGSVWGAVVAAGLWAVGSASVDATSQLAFGLGAMFLARNGRGVVGWLAVMRGRLGEVRRAVARAAALQTGRFEAAAVYGDGAEAAAEREGPREALGGAARGS